MKMKKLICLLMSLILLVCAAGCSCRKEIAGTESKNVGKNTVYVSDAKGKKGDEVVVKITAGDETPVAAYTLLLKYDETMLEMAEYGTTEEFEKAYKDGINLDSDDAGVISFAGANATESQEKFRGDMFYVKFKIIGETKGDTQLELSLVSLTTYDEVAHVDEFTAVNGKITVE